jgi:hypothetical protein
MRGRVNARGGAAVVGDAVEFKGLRQSAMRQQNRAAFGRAGQPIGVVEVDEPGEQESERARDPDDPFHGPRCVSNVVSATNR